MSARFGLVATLVGLILPFQLATAQQSPLPTKDDIIIEGQRPGSAGPLVDKLSKAPKGRQVARWYRSVCIKVDGVDATWTAYLEGEIARIAATVDVRREPRPCATTDTIYVYVTAHADLYMDILTKRHPGLYRNTFLYGLASRAELATLKAPRPVRWFDGHQFELINPSAGRTMMMGREDKTFSVVIVDAQKLTNVSWQQLAAYLAMVSLTNPGMDEQYGRNDTILALFERRAEGKPMPVGLTSLDQRILHGFYSFSDKLPDYLQRHQIALSIERSGKTGTP